MKKTVRIFVSCLLTAVLFMCPVFSVSAEAANPTESPVIDLDLSRMSDTVAYAKMNNLLSDPVPWLGKVIRLAGIYSFFDDEDHGIVYHACVIPDATASCTMGLEFIWAGEHNWPEDYPEEGIDITVTGRLDVYDVDGFSYLHLVDAELLWDRPF